jgi:hypothetical protein
MGGGSSPYRSKYLYPSQRGFSLDIKIKKKNYIKKKKINKKSGKSALVMAQPQ